MTSFEQTLLREIATLPESRQADVLAFVRLLKVRLPDKERTRHEFKDALKEARATARQFQLTQEDIAAEIQAVRDGK